LPTWWWNCDTQEKGEKGKEKKPGKRKNRQKRTERMEAPPVSFLLVYLYD
jgi:hypothetical protein